MREESLRWAWY